MNNKVATASKTFHPRKQTRQGVKVTQRQRGVLQHTHLHPETHSSRWRLEPSSVSDSSSLLDPDSKKS